MEELNRIEVPQTEIVVEKETKEKEKETHRVMELA